MTIRLRTLVVGAFVLAAVVAGLSLFVRRAGSQAQAPRYTVARTADGKPDLTGIWQVLNRAEWDLEAHSSQMGPSNWLDIPAGQGVVEGNEIPYQPHAAAKKKDNAAKRLTADPIAQCYLPGVPRATYMGFPLQIAQTADHVIIAYEYDHALRYIPTNGSSHPDGALYFWMGDSRGRWEADSLVVDVTKFTDQTWFDRAGNFHSDALHVVERYTPKGPDHLNYEVTIEDPKVFTRSWKLSMPLYRRVEDSVQLLEFPCVEFALEREFPPRTAARFSMR